MRSRSVWFGSVWKPLKSTPKQFYKKVQVYLGLGIRNPSKIRQRYNIVVGQRIAGSLLPSGYQPLSESDFLSGKCKPDTMCAVLYTAPMTRSFLEGGPCDVIRKTPLSLYKTSKGGPLWHGTPYTPLMGREDELRGFRDPNHATRPGAGPSLNHGSYC